MQINVSESQLSEFKVCFEKADRDLDGKIALTSLKSILISLKYLASDEEFKKALAEIEVQNQRLIDFSDCLTLLNNLNRKNIEKYLLDVYKFYRRDSGQLMPEDLRYLLITLNSELSDEEIDSLTKDSKPLYFEDFLKIMII